MNRFSKIQLLSFILILWSFITYSTSSVHLVNYIGTKGSNEATRYTLTHVLSHEYLPSNIERNHQNIHVLPLLKFLTDNNSLSKNQGLFCCIEYSSKSGAVNYPSQSQLLDKICKLQI